MDWKKYTLASWVAVFALAYLSIIVPALTGTLSASLAASSLIVTTLILIVVIRRRHR